MPNRDSEIEACESREEGRTWRPCCASSHSRLRYAASPCSWSLLPLLCRSRRRSIGHRHAASAQCEDRPLAPPGQVVCVGTGGPAEVPLDERQAGAPVLGVHGVHAAWVRLRRGSRGPQRSCSLLHARHTRPPRLPPDRLPLGRPIRRVAGGLLQAPRRGARNQCDSSGVSLHRRADLGSPRATRKRDRLHGQMLGMARSCRLLQWQAISGTRPIRVGVDSSRTRCAFWCRAGAIGVGLLLIGSAGGFRSRRRSSGRLLAAADVLPFRAGCRRRAVFRFRTRRPPLPVAGDLCRSGGPHACRWTAGHRSRISRVPGVHAFSPQRRLLAPSRSPRPASVFCLSPHGGAVRRVAADFYVSSTDWSSHAPRHGSA